MDREAIRRPCHPQAKYGYSAAVAKFLAEAPAPRLLLVRVKAGPPAAYKRDLDPAACRIRFRNAYLAAG